jgi:hypothetical protein
MGIRDCDLEWSKGTSSRRQSLYWDLKNLKD